MIVSPSSRVQVVEEYYFSRKLKEISQMITEGKNVLNLGIGNPDLPPSEDVVDCLIDAARKPNTHGYQSYNGLQELREAYVTWMNEKFGVKGLLEDNVLPLIGSKEGVMHLAMTFLETGDQVLVPNPGYPSYTATARLAGAETVEFKLLEEEEWTPDWEFLESLDTARIKLMWINYPNMPTGAKATKETLSRLVNYARENNILLCHDNPYAFILNKRKPLSIFSVEGSRECCVELHSLSKSFNMAGWRLGAMVADAGILKEVMNFKSNMDSGMFKPLQLAAIRALQLDDTWYDKMNNVYASRKKVVVQLLETIGCTIDGEQQGMFVWAKVPKRYKDGYDLSDDILYNRHVFLTPGGIFGSQGNSFVRISLCTPVEVLREALYRIKDKTVKA